MNQKPEALIFDFDGVLADTERLHWKAWATLLAMRDIEFSWEDYCKVGRGVQDESMLGRIAQLSADPSLLASVRLDLPNQRQMVKRCWREKLPIGEATRQLLHDLRGYPLGLVTTSKRADVEPMLHSAQIADCFSATVFGEDTIHHKPHPAPYNLIRERLGIQDGVVFEDSEPGLQSATRAGFEALRIPDPDDLPGIVRGYLNVSRASDSQ